MPEYNYKDVIIDPKDSRVEIGAEYWFGMTPKDCIGKANSGKMTGRLAFMADEDKPFGCHTGSAHSLSFPCIICKKEPKKKLVPFDLLNEEDRAKLRGAWVRSRDVPNNAYQITRMNAKYVFLGNRTDCISPDTLKDVYEFIDGSPCGQEVEE